MMSVIEFLYSTAYLVVGASFLVGVWFVGTPRKDTTADAGDTVEDTYVLNRLDAMVAHAA